MSSSTIHSFGSASCVCEAGTANTPCSNTDRSHSTCTMIITDMYVSVDEAEGFLLEHALFSPPRSWPPLPPPREDDDLPAGYIPPHPPARTQSDRLAGSRRKMDWDTEMATHPDEPVEIPVPAKIKSEEDDANSERCVICLMALRDRTIVGVCGHEFCVSVVTSRLTASRYCSALRVARWLGRFGGAGRAVCGPC